jgi:hypothetical protein
MLCDKYGAELEYDTSVILEESQHFDTIILNTEKIGAFESQLKTLRLPIVSLDWIENCILQDKFMEPANYEIIKPQNQKKNSSSNLFFSPFFIPYIIKLN